MVKVTLESPEDQLFLCTCIGDMLLLIIGYPTRQDKFPFCLVSWRDGGHAGFN